MYTVAVIMFCIFLCIWEIYIFYHNSKALEDIVIAVVSGGVAMFLIAMKVSGVLA